MKRLKTLGKYLVLFLKAFNVLSIIFLLLLYFIVKKVGIHFDWFIMMIYPCGICFIYIVHEFILMFETFKENEPFNSDNIERLKKSMKVCFIISLLVVIALLINIFLYSYYSLQLRVALAFIAILFFGVGVALYIISVLFKQAVKYKEENDLTI